jgi:pyroglutamyl-peptidase
MDSHLVLVTGFGAFEEVERNPSGLLAEGLVENPPAGVECVGGTLPVSFRRAPRVMDELFARLGARRPELIFSLGVCPEAGFRIESRAGDRLRAGRPDVDGEEGASLGSLGPERSTSLDVEALAARVAREAAAPVRVSGDAGGYVCERIYHHALSRADELAVPALFLHVPPSDLLPLEVQERAVRVLLLAALESLMA